MSSFFGTYSKMKAALLILKMFNKTFMHSDLKKQMKLYQMEK